MSLTQWLRILWARRLLVLLTLAGVLAGAAVIAWQRPYVYAGKTRIVIDLSKDPITGAVVAPRSFEMVIATQTALIQDPSVIERAARILGYLPANKPNPSDYAALTAERRLVTNLGNGLFVTNVPDSNLIDILAYTNSPEESKRFSEAVRQAYIELSVRQQRASAIGALSVMQDQMRRFLAQRTEASQRRAAFERRYNVVLHENGGNFDEDGLNQIANASDDQLRQMAKAGAASSAAARNAVVLSRIDAALATAQATLGPNHPQVQALVQQRAAAAAVAQAPIRAQNASMSVDTLMSHKVEQLLADRGILAEGRMLVNQEYIYDSLMRGLAARIVTTAQQANVSNGGVTPVGAPTAEFKPTAPNFTLIGVLAAVIGLILGVQIAIIVELLNRRVRGIEDLATFGVPMLTPGRQGEDREEAAVPELVAAA
ncbi:chain length determinant protein [Novosphingobium sp. UBA1939]|uniref:chain length determinant protein n=1 Tax=Novosphingobium sp. UBA1939 TaxID=1946982 RepID=UPI0025DD53F7|nr:chain length determinant protein [Novosphingobium sp. UBA1939]